MKKSLLIISAILIALSSYSQDSTININKKQKEVAIAFRNLNNFGLSYKFGNSRSMWRINTLLSEGGKFEQKYDSTTRRKSSSIGFGVQFGKEFRKEIAKKLELRYGADVSFTFNYSKIGVSSDSFTETVRYIPSLNLIFGFNYEIKNNIIFGIEIMPNISYSISESSGTDNTIKTTSIDYGLSNNSALLTIAYRF